MNDVENDVETHPAYGMVSISKITRGGDSHSPMFGSRLTCHPTTIRLRVSEGRRCFHLHEDTFSSGRVLIDLELTPTQFAELLTSTSGDGVPCTLLRANGAQIPPLEAYETATARALGDVRDVGSKIASKVRALHDVLNTVKLSQKDKAALATAISNLSVELSMNVPFLLEQVSACADKMVVEAKAEADAFLTSLVNRLGVKTLRALDHNLLSEGGE